ncbi:MAG: DNA polymerase, partial [Gammaproteobacteria bacterium]|nr:DNA polymerase [Gammaproteobacteria bacterium]
CSKDMASYYNTMITKKKDMVRSTKIIEDKIDYSKVIHWDLETFQPVEDGVRHEIYASGFYDKKYRVFYGQDAMEKTIDHFLKFENKIISAYNGSGFDFSFLLDSLTERGAIITKLIMNNGKLMGFSWHIGKDESKSNKIFDLFLFTLPSGLKKACMDFKIENQKGDFDHEKMKSWDDVARVARERRRSWMQILL